MRLLHFLALYFSMASIALRTDFSRTLNYLTLDKLGDYRLDILVYDQFLKTVSNFLLWGLGEFCFFCLECSFSGCSCAWFLVVDQVSVWLAAFPRSRSGSAAVSGLSFRTLVAISSPLAPSLGDGTITLACLRLCHPGGITQESRELVRLLHHSEPSDSRSQWHIYSLKVSRKCFWPNKYVILLCSELLWN